MQTCPLSLFVWCQH